MSRTVFFRAAALAAIFVGAPLYWWAFPPTLPIGTANGVFTSGCCGSLRLRDGLLTSGDGQEVTYVVEHDKIGRYVLPKGYVGASGRDLIVRRGGNPLKLRLDGEPRPTRIEVTNDASDELVAFDRRNGG